MKKITLLAAALIAATTGAQASQWYCSPAGAGDQTGDSWTNAFPAENIADVLENVEAGDIVYLLEGTYTGTNILPVEGITVVGGFPAAATGTDVSQYNPWLYRTVFDAKGKNGGTALLRVDGDKENPTYALTTFKGITITGCVGLETDTYSGTAFNCTRANILLEDVTFKGNTSWKGGCVVPASGSRFHALHCVWDGNQNIKNTTTSNNDFQSVINGRGSSTSVTNIVLEGCVMVNNSIADPTARAAACYGGDMSFQDAGCNLMMVNCFADGGGQTIKQNGGMLRMGNNMQLFLLAFNTFCNYATSSTPESKGNVLSINGNTPYYLQGNIIVDKVAGTTVTPNYTTGTVSNGNKTDIAIFTQGFSNNHGARVPYIQSGGDNTVGGFLVATIQKDQNGEAGSMYKTSFLTDFPSDNWSAPAQSDIFAGTTTAADGRYYILPKETYKDVTMADALDNFDSYKSLPCYEPFKFANVDLSLDLFGNKRAATTYRGAYDPNATVNTGIASTLGDGRAVTVKALGNGIYELQGATGTAAVYDMAGRLVMTHPAAEGNLSLASQPRGIYVVHVDGTAAKVVR